MNRTIEDIANEVLRCARSWDGGAMLLGNIEAREAGGTSQLAASTHDITGRKP